MSPKNNKEKKKLAVLISNVGTGTNLAAIIDAIKSGKINAEICAVISDRAEAAALSHALQNKVHIEICPKKEDLLPLLKKLNPDYICLAGWKQIISEEVIASYPDKILNLHPGLVPDTVDTVAKNPDGTDAIWNKGMLANIAIQNFLYEKNTYAGSSIHYLTTNFDFGPVLGRTYEKIQEGDNVLSLYTRLKIKENELYVEVLGKLCNT